jgi:phage shock protein PspC (stress-responsive transcriptional regulator)
MGGRLYRSSNGVIAGVCAGIAEFFGLDVRTLRIVWVVLAIVGVGSPVLFYLLICIIVPVRPLSSRYEERMRERLGRRD